MLIASSSKLKWQPNGSVIPPGTSASARWVWPSCATGTASRRSRGRTHMARTATAPIPQEPTDADKAREALRHQRLRTRHKGEASESEIPASLTPSSAPRSVSPLSVPPTRRTRRREDPTPVADVLTAWVTRQGIALPPNCGICGSRGFVIEQRRSLMAPPYCSCEWGVRARRRDAIDRSTMLLEVHRARREALARKLVLPAQHQRFTLETHPLANRQEQGHAMYVDVLSWLAHWDWRRGLILLGGYGIGKTGLVCGVLQRLVERAVTEGWEMRFITSLGLVRRIQSGYGDDTAAATIDEYSRVHLLALDDLGAERTTTDRQRLQLHTLDHRHRESLPLLATTNLRDEDLRAHLTERVYWRLFETCDFVTVERRKLRA